MTDKETKEVLEEAGDPMAWKRKFKVSREKLEQFQNQEMLEPGLFGAGQYNALIAESNGAKTTIVMSLAPGWVKRGYKVTYVNADIAANDALEAFDQAEEGGFDLLLPDCADGGVSMRDVVDGLENALSLDVTFDREVWVFDTLKKMTDVIDKRASKRLYETLRKLTAKGMTVIVQGHANKYPDADGMPVYEGTVDLRTDCDNLIYFIPDHHEDKSITVSVVPDKKRAPLEKMSFEVSPNREVRRGDFVDVATMLAQKRKLADDHSAIEEIEAYLEEGVKVQTDILAHLNARLSVGRRTGERILKDYSAKDVGEELTEFKRWYSQRRMDHNSIQYWKKTIPPYKRTNVQSTPTKVGESGVFDEWMAHEH